MQRQQHTFTQAYPHTYKRRKRQNRGTNLGTCKDMHKQTFKKKLKHINIYIKTHANTNMEKYSNQCNQKE